MKSTEMCTAQSSIICLTSSFVSLNPIHTQSPTTRSPPFSNPSSKYMRHTPAMFGRCRHIRLLFDTRSPIRWGGLLSQQHRDIRWTHNGRRTHNGIECNTYRETRGDCKHSKIQATLTHNVKKKDSTPKHTKKNQQTRQTQTTPLVTYLCDMCLYVLTCNKTTYSPPIWADAFDGSVGTLKFQCSNIASDADFGRWGERHIPRSLCKQE